MPGLIGEVANLIVSLKLDDRGFSGKLNTIGRNLGKLDSGLSQMGKGVGQVGSGLARLGTVAAAAAAGGLAAVVSTAVSFEDAFAGVRKTVDASDEELDVLMDTFREMARTIPVSFEELAAIGSQAGALGIATSAIDEFTEVVALLGETTDVTTDQAATSLGVLANVLHLREEDFDNFGSALVDLGNKGASTESQILAIAERAGAGASLIGVAADQTLGWASAAANLGIEVEAGGSALQKFFLETLNNIQDDDTLQVMAETAGVTADAFKKGFEKDASGALAIFIKGLGKLDDASRLNVLKNLGFDDIRIQRLLLGLSGDADMLAASLTIANEAWEENTALQTEAAKRFETTRSKLDLLIGNLRDVGYVIGNEIIPIVADLSTDFVDFLNQAGTQKGIGEFARDLAGGIRDFAKEIKGTDFSGIIDGMKLAAEVAKGAFDAFRSLPAPIQQLAIAALVANKVSGGAVGQIAKGLGNILLGGAKVGGGLAGLFGGRGASPANPMFVAVTNQIPGGGPGGVGGKGGLPGFLGVLGLSGLFTVAAGAFASWFETNVAQPSDPTGFDYRAAALRSNEFPNPNAANVFARDLAKELDIPLGEVESGIAYSVSALGLTFDQAVAKLRTDVQNVGRNVKETGNRAPKPILGPPVPTGPIASLSSEDFISRLAKTTEIGLKDVGTSIENGIKTGLDPFGQGMLALAQSAENPKEPAVLGEINRHIIAAEELQRAYIKSGDLNSAKEVQVTIDGLHRLAGTTDKSNGYLATLAGNLAASRSDERSMLDNLRSSQGYLARISEKDFSPTINLTNIVPIKIGLTSLQTQIYRTTIANRLTTAGIL